MAYVQTQSSSRRFITLCSVAALHAAAIYALIAGFGAKVWEKVDAVFPAKSWKADPPPPEPSPSVAPSAPAETRIFAPKPIIEPLPRRDTTMIDLTPIPQPSFDPGPLVKDPPVFDPPSPTPSFLPRAATPLSDPGRWATTDDYPARALREERQGTTQFRVTVGADGRVRNCEIVASSGSADLDAATCANVARRARFKPATDASGAKVGGSYSNAVRWEIPG